jgi:hypothetical protein
MTVIQVVILILIAFVLSLYLRVLFTKKAVDKVIALFYQHKALTAKNAKTRQELGLMPHNVVQRMTKPRDYRQAALHILMQRGIIAMTEEGGLYLVEEKLDPSLRNRGRSPKR